jgi:hypothetical protein
MLKKMKKIAQNSIKPFKESKFSRSNLVAFILIFGLIGGYFLIKSFALSCTMSSPASSTSDRKIPLNLNGCSGTRYFRVSESQDFGASNGVQVHVNNVASDKSYADVSVTYPGGTSATGSTPFSVPAQHDVKVLAVLFTFQDDNGQTVGLGDYETPSWVQKMVFDGGNFDGVNTNNSIKDFDFQSTNGRINLTGSVYPQIIKLPLERYRQVLGSGGRTQVDFGQDLVKTIEASNPGYMNTNKFDFLLGLSSEQYSVNRNLYPQGVANVQDGSYSKSINWISLAIPADLSKSAFANTIQDTRTSTDTRTVITRYNPSAGSVEGVWLASDPNRTGTNYYTGGSIIVSPDTQFSYLNLGTALPNSNTQVIVRYKAAISTQVNTSSANAVSMYGLYSFNMHELHHTISQVPDYRYGQRGILGDLYYHPGLGANFDVMADGKLNRYDPAGNSFDSPTLLGAYNRVMEGFATPHTLQYGQNESSIRLYRSENGDPANSSRSSIIKIPLVPRGDQGLETRDYVFGSGQVSSTTPSRQYQGSEYLLLEWRNKDANALENNAYNFDKLLTSDGLVIYHVVESATYELTAATYDIARVLDATPDNPAFNEGYSDTTTSPATFGPQSGVMTYTTQAYWQEKTPANDTHSFQYLLSPGAGTKTLYVQYADSSGNITGTQQLTVSSTSTQQPADRMPTMSLNMPDGTSITGFRNVAATYSAPNGAKNIRFYVDNVLNQETNETNISPTSTSFFISTSNYSPGTHQLKVVFYDGGMNQVTNTVSFTTVGGGDTTAPTVSISSPTNNSTVWGTIAVSTSSTDGNGSGVVKSELYIDGDLAESTLSANIRYVWYTAQIANGSHTLIAKVYDAAGNIATTPSIVVVQNTSAPPADTTQPVVSLTTPAGGSTVFGNVNVSANAIDNVGVSKVEFYIDGSLASSDTDNPFSYAWDTTTLSNGSHTISAKAYDAAGNSATDQVSVTVANADTTPPSTPSGLIATAAAYNRVNLSWSASTDNVGVAGYYIVRDGTTIAQTTGTATTYSDTTVSSSTSYSYQVMAYDAKNNTSGLSSTAQVTTPAVPDTQSPTAPSNLSATVVSSSQINLAWTASTDNVGVATYDVYRNNSKVTSLAASSACTGGACSWGDGGLSSNAQYSYYLIAKDSAGNSSTLSNTAVATTQAPPVTTGNLTGTVSSSKGGAVASGSVTLTLSSGKRGTTLSTTTNSSGNYSQSNITPGSYPLTFSKTGFTSQTVTVTITANNTTTKNITLVSKR